MNVKTLFFILVAVIFIGCGASPSSFKKNDGKGDIDLAEYYPEKFMTKTFLVTKRDGEEFDYRHHDKIVEVEGETILFIEDIKEVEKVIIFDANITIIKDSKSISIYRYADIGDTLFLDEVKEVKETDLGKAIINVDIECKLASKVEQFEQGDNKYSGDLLKVECLRKGTSTIKINEINSSYLIHDKSYSYLKKGIGLVAEVNNDCIPSTILAYVNDNAKACVKEQYKYKFYLP